MKRSEALKQAQEAGYTMAIHAPYAYHKRTITSHINEALKFENDHLVYDGSAASMENWQYLPDENIVENSEGQIYFLLRTK